MQSLTPIQKNVLLFVEEHVRKHSMAPTQDEIRRHFGWSSLGTAHKHLRLLERKGYIRLHRNQTRNIEVLVPVGAPRCLFSYGPGGALVTDDEPDPRLRVPRLCDETARYYGGRYLIAESMSHSTAKRLAHLLGGVLLERRPLALPGGES